MHEDVVFGELTPLAVQADVVGINTPSSKQNTSRTILPTPHGALQEDHGPVAYEYTCTIGASRGYGGLGVGVREGVHVLESLTGDDSEVEGEGNVVTLLVTDEDTAGDVLSESSC